MTIDHDCKSGSSQVIWGRIGRLLGKIKVSGSEGLGFAYHKEMIPGFVKSGTKNELDIHTRC